MADYIRRDIVLKIINTVNDTGGFAGYADYCVLFDEIDTMPASNVQPVKHGYWTDLNNDAIYHYECSCCKGHTGWHEKFCPNCGARMDGDVLKCVNCKGVKENAIH